MKSNLKHLPTMLLAIILLSSCINMTNTISPSKTIITRDYKVKEFAKINVGVAGNIYYTQSADGKTSVKISGPENYIALFKVTVKDSTLFISTPEDKNLRSLEELKINITTPYLNDICARGVGNFYIKDGLKTDQLNLVIEGVGNTKIDLLYCRSFNLHTTGVGNIALQGKTQSATFYSEGVGNIEAEDFQADNVKATASGVGNISCYAVKTIDATTKGVGSIKYKGNPSAKLESKGIGSIKQL